MFQPSPQIKFSIKQIELKKECLTATNILVLVILRFGSHMTKTLLGLCQEDPNSCICFCLKCDNTGI